MNNKKEAMFSIEHIDKNENSLNAVVKLDANHAIYKGHFPGNPITPGVIQLEILKSIITSYYNRKCKISNMASSKFLSILNPLKNPTVDVEIKYEVLDTDNIKIVAQIRAESEVFMKVKANFKFN